VSRPEVTRVDEGVSVKDGPLCWYFPKDHVVGQALLELLDRREADVTPTAPGNADHYDSALEALVLARRAVIDAMRNAIASDAYYRLCQAVSEVTNALTRVEYARKGDAS
jgi:hypothetical protein